ncbi:hypothetical protein P8452_29695 [Trifolium repens]|uniref:Dehydrin b n=1 Tax=Trifolium repens TaxID=3899 RepID=D3YBC2_TRIRP|nr:dehydrin b [Trifolium repens]WJX42463.1 hypothetical protein P8452_29695 [Trifolium repens]
MAEENQNKYEDATSTTNSETEIKDRGVFDFLGGKKKDEEHKPQEEAISTDFSHKVTLYEAPSETKVEEAEGEKKHTSLLEKLHRSDSSSSSSSEEEDENGEKRKKKKKEKKEKKEDTSVPVEKVEVVDGTTVVTEEKKGFLEKIKDKLPGHKKTEDVTTPPPVVTPVPTEITTTTSHDQGEKKGILEKIKEKIPGYHPKTTTDHEDKDHHKDETASH